MLTQRPIDLLTQRPIDLLTQRPIDLLTQRPIDLLTQRPIDLLTQRPIDLLTQRPIDLLTQRPIDLLTQRPIDLLTQRPIDLLTQRPIDLLTQRPIDLLTRRPVDLKIHLILYCRRLEATPEELADLTRVVAQVKALLNTPGENNNENVRGVFNAILSSPFIMRGIITLNLADFQNQKGHTLLTLAARYGYQTILETMIESGAYVDLRDEDGWTSLIWGARNNHTAIVKRLLELNADPNIKNRNYGDSALTWAAYNGRLNIVRDLLAAGATVDIPNLAGNTALTLAAEGLGDRLGVLKVLIENGANVNHLDDDGTSALIKASKKNHVEEVQVLLRAGANPDIRESNYGDTALGWASASGYTGVVRELVAVGTNLNLKNNNDVTPLLLATIKNHIPAAQVLLAAGADINERGGDGETPVMRAVFLQLRGMVLTLLQHCPDLTLTNLNRKNVMQMATQRGDQEIKKMISEHSIRFCLHDNQLHVVGNVRYTGCKQVRCCHGNWTLTGVVLPSCGQSCRTVGSPAGVCRLARDCPTLVTEFSTANADTNTGSLAQFIRLYSCGFTSGEDLQVCCPTTSIPLIDAVDPRINT
ncbi:hypothetical protein Pmani_035357 [Petrolisthes manimaculis]|uniref:Clip domain-containing protein n=1 Tax=Petrolisthes manimaculis TaxID=1843537 RepID=A0AAE1NLV6_9EUCA|nr:hypothetical protein Pmani_035357 [Petrolisthes manimaculis]